MNWMLFFFAALLLCICAIAYLTVKLCRVREQLSVIEGALKDIKEGNLNRRVLAKENDLTKTVCYSINEITTGYQAQLVRMKQSEQSYKRLMTSLSHDIKTPLTSLVGYLEAIQNKMVTEEEKDGYIGVALEKAHRLKGFVESLFEWVKLDAKEQIFQFEICDLNEVSRNIIADWIPVLEDKQFTYKIDIPETEYSIRLDRNAYMRILGNLLQNVIVHSGGNEVSIHISEDEKQAKIIIADNGKGIPDKDLPHIFERLYQGDESRRSVGNGLGLSIVKALVTAHGGTIYAESPPNGGTILNITLPKALRMAVRY